MAEPIRYLSGDDVLAAMPPVADRLALAERTMVALVAEVRQGRAGEGMAAAVAAIGAILAENFPKTEADTNELPDRLIEL